MTSTVDAGGNQDVKDIDQTRSYNSGICYIHGIASKMFGHLLHNMYKVGVFVVRHILNNDNMQLSAFLCDIGIGIMHCLRKGNGAPILYIPFRDHSEFITWGKVEVLTRTADQKLVPP